MTDKTGITIKCEEGGQANAFEHFGEKALNVYRVELVIERGTMRGRITRGHGSPMAITEIVTIDVSSIDLSFMGSVLSAETQPLRAPDYLMAHPSAQMIVVSSDESCGRSDG